MRLVSLEERHVLGLQRVVDEPAIAVPAGLPVPAPSDWAATFVAQRTLARQTGEAYSFAIESAAGEQFFGVCSLHHVCAERADAELAFFVGLPWWGRGLGRAAARQVIRFAFQTLRLQMLHARCLPGNERARRVLLACGFRRSRSLAEPEGNPRRDSAKVFSLPRASWEGRGGETPGTPGEEQAPDDEPVPGWR